MPSNAPSQAAAGPSNPQPTAFNPRPPPSPLSHAIPMSGISFATGGGFSFDKNSGMMGRSMRIASGGGGVAGSGPAGSYGARFYGGGIDSPLHTFSTSITMDSSSFTTSSAAFNLPPPLGASYRSARSYAAAARGERDRELMQGGAGPSHHPSNALSSSFASMSFQPMSFGTGSYSKSQVQSLMARPRHGPRTDAEMTTSYECCGVTHHGLHDLLEHVEDAHPFTDSDTAMAMGTSVPATGAGALPVSTGLLAGTGSASGPIQHIGFSPQVMAMDMDLDAVEASALGTIEERASGAGSSRSSMSPTAIAAVPSYPVPISGSSGSSKPTTPSEVATSPAPLQISDVLTSPFADSLLSSSSQPRAPPLSSGIRGDQGSGPSEASTCSSPPDGSLATPTTSQQPSPVFTVPKIGPARGFLGAVPRPSPQRFDRAFNEVVAGHNSPKNATTKLLGGEKDKAPQPPTAVAPGVLFASAVAGLGIPTTPPVPGQQPTAGGVAGAGVGAGAGTAANGQGTTAPIALDGSIAAGGSKAVDPPLPQPSLFTTHKPWRCPNPGCNKAYKQSNGLKYHQQKGQCDFAIHDAVDLGLSMEEAEERSRPFICAVGAGCHKRYRQMNGLKYHYLNSGEHGQYGLRMIQNGTHPMPAGTTAGGSISTTSTPAAGSTASGAGSTLKRPLTTVGSTLPRSGAAPYTIPSQIGATRPGAGAAASTTGATQHPLPRMGVFPPSQRPAGQAGQAGAAGAAGGLAGIGRAGVPVRPNPLASSQALPARNPPAVMANQGPLPPIQRGRDAVLFAAVDTMDL